MNDQKKIRIAFIDQPFEKVVPPHIGGSIALWTERVMRSLPAGEAEFIVYIPRYLGQPAIEWHDGIQYRRFSNRSDELVAKFTKLIDRSLGFPRPKKAYFSSQLHYLGYIFQLSNDLRAQKVDIVHIHNFSQFVPVIRALNPRVKIVLHMNCEWLSQLDEAMIRGRIQKADLVIGCSEHISGKIRARFPEFKNRVVTVYNGGDENMSAAEQPTGTAVETTARPFKLLFVGRISPEKGVHVLVEAIQQVLRQYPDAELNLIGPWGEMPAEYLVLLGEEKHVANLRRFYQQGRKKNSAIPYGDYVKSLIQPEFSSKINFLGFIPHDRVMEYYQSADLFLNSSLSDAFPLPVPEAMNNHLPVVASRVGGVPEAVVDGETGLLVEPGNADDLANAILCMLRDEYLRKKMGQASYERCMSLFTYPVIAASLFVQYRRLL